MAVSYKCRTRRVRERASAIAATEAAKTFGRLVDRVREERAVYVVERGGTPVARIGPIGAKPFTMREFKAMLAAMPPASDEYLRGVEAVVGRANKPRVPRNPWAR